MHHVPIKKKKNQASTHILTFTHMRAQMICVSRLSAAAAGGIFQTRLSHEIWHKRCQTLIRPVSCTSGQLKTLLSSPSCSSLWLCFFFFFTFILNHFLKFFPHCYSLVTICCYLKLIPEWLGLITPVYLISTWNTYIYLMLFLSWFVKNLLSLLPLSLQSPEQTPEVALVLEKNRRGIKPQLFIASLGGNIYMYIFKSSVKLMSVRHINLKNKVQSWVWV